MQATNAAASGVAPTVGAFFVLWLTLDRSAAGLGSTRGEHGWLVCAIVTTVAIAAEGLLSGSGPGRSIRALGFAFPRPGAALLALAFAGTPFLFFPALAVSTGEHLTSVPDFAPQAAGIFAQGGVAEELVFRGFLFRRLRAGRTFWRAAVLSSAPFVAVHGFLFVTLDFEVALLALLLSLSLSFPLAWLFELAGASVWPPALVHATVQGAAKLSDAGSRASVAVALWMVFSATTPWLFLLWRPRDER
jgi:membrane protease YdiL (CAAX protease family)